MKNIYIILSYPKKNEKMDINNNNDLFYIIIKNEY